MSRFRPLLPGGHLQTLGGVLARSFLKWPFPSEDVVVDAGHDVRLLLRASWQEKGADRPGLLLVHGLEGTDESDYLVSTGVAAFRFRMARDPPEHARMWRFTLTVPAAL